MGSCNRAALSLCSAKCWIEKLGPIVFMGNAALGFFAATGMLGALLVAPARAQEFPAKPLRLIVPLLPGSGTDVVARTFASALAQGLGQAVVIENKAGAATTLGANFVAKSTPDGYTLLVATTSTLSVL